LAKVMWHAGEGVGWDDQDRLFRATLAVHGLKRLTPNVVSRLRAVWSLARTQPPPFELAVHAELLVGVSSAVDASRRG